MPDEGEAQERESPDSTGSTRDPEPGGGGTPELELASTVTASGPTGESARIGPYRLLQKVGEGGMGEVWLAEQTEPVRRRVALKVIKQGMDTKQVIARFEAERQALALMDHPGVARIFDAGATPEGRPYFVMEYVQGLPITVHCDQHKLTTRERLELFLQACDAVQHAHQKAILHRDLKPSNALVSIQDGHAVLKIIDFGVAKATAQRLTERTLFTELGVLIGTPEYMSPEQADLTAQDVDTRTDVYSLGVILYELLVGALPFEPKELRSAGLDGIRRMIRQVEPPKPSTRLGTLGGERSTDSASHRRVDVPTLRRQLSGDLDWITMKALEKDRARRYGSPAELAADLQRHLGHEPVLAGPPSAAYRARKFVRRNRFGVAVAAVGFLVLNAFGVAMVAQARRIAREAEAKGRVSEFLQELFQVSDPGEARGNSITARELLDKGAAKIRTGLTMDPHVRADLMATMGSVYSSLGLYAEAESLLREALESRRRLLGADDRETLLLASVTGRLYRLEGHFDKAETILRGTLDTQKRVLGPEALDTLTSMDNLAATYAEEGRYQEAEALYREAVDARKRILGPEHPDTLLSMNGLATVYTNQGRYKDSEALILETFQIRKRVLGPEHPDTMKSMINLAVIYADTGRYQEALELDREVADIRKRVLGPEHPDTLLGISALAADYSSLGRKEEADSLYREVLDVQRRVLGPEHPDTLTSMHNLGIGYSERGRFPEAEDLHREVLEIQKRVLGPEHPDTLQAMYYLAVDYAGQKRYGDAEALLRKVVDIQTRVLGAEHPDTLWSIQSLADDYGGQERYQEAEALQREVVEIRRRVLGPDHPDTLQSAHNLALDLNRLQRYADAEALDRETLEKRRRVLGPEHAATLWSSNNLAFDLTRLQRYAEAESLDRETLEIRRRVLGPEHPDTLMSMNDLALACNGLRRYSEAEALNREVLEIRKRVLGPKHPDTLISIYNMGCTAALRGKRPEALRYLRDAVDEGFSDVALMTWDSDLVSLRGSPEYDAIVAKARTNQARAARAR